MPRKKKDKKNNQPDVATQEAKPLGTLPVGWAATTLGEIVLPSRERGLPNEHPDLPYIGMEHVESQTMRLIGKGNALDIRSTSVLFKKGDILYGKMRPYLNKVWVAEFDGLCSAEFLVFPCPEGLNSRFLALRLNSQDFVTFANQAVSGDRPRVDFDKLAPFQVLLPPSAEQERIVAKLDAMLSRIAAGESAARRALERLDCYRASVLHAAVTGELTREWRKTHKPDETGEQLLKRLLIERRKLWEHSESQRLVSMGKKPKNEKWKDRYTETNGPIANDLHPLPNGWAWASLQQLGFIIGGLTKNPKRANFRLKLPYLRVGNVYANELRLDEMKTIGVQQDELDKLLLEKGDLLIVEGNGSKDQIGRLAVWDGSIEKCVHQNHIIKVRLVEKSLSTWILSWLLSPLGRHCVEKVASSTTGLYTLSVGKIGALPIPLPPHDEQAVVVREVDNSRNRASHLTHKLNLQFDQANAARQSVLSEAFIGKLVHQDPKDEPTSQLLSRISRARETQVRKPKVKRMAKPKLQKVDNLDQLVELVLHLGKDASPERLLVAAGLGDDVDKFFDLLRAGRDNGRLIVPTGESSVIRRA